MRTSIHTSAATQNRKILFGEIDQRVHTVCNETVAAGVCVKPVCPAVTLFFNNMHGLMDD